MLFSKSRPCSPSPYLPGFGRRGSCSVRGGVKKGIDVAFGGSYQEGSERQMGLTRITHSSCEPGDPSYKVFVLGHGRDLNGLPV